MGYAGSIWKKDGIKERYNIGKGEMTLGYYWEVLRLIKDTSKEGKDALLYMRPEQSRAVKKTLYDFLALKGYQ